MPNYFKGHIGIKVEKGDIQIPFIVFDAKTNALNPLQSFPKQKINHTTGRIFISNSQEASY